MLVFLSRATGTFHNTGKTFLPSRQVSFYSTSSRQFTGFELANSIVKTSLESRGFKCFKDDNQTVLLELNDLHKLALYAGEKVDYILLAAMKLIDLKGDGHPVLHSPFVQTPSVMTMRAELDAFEGHSLPKFVLNRAERNFKSNHPKQQGCPTHSQLLAHAVMTKDMPIVIALSMENDSGIYAENDVAHAAKELLDHMLTHDECIRALKILSGEKPNIPGMN